MLPGPSPLNPIGTSTSSCSKPNAPLPPPASSPGCQGGNLAVILVSFLLTTNPQTYQVIKIQPPQYS